MVEINSDLLMSLVRELKDRVSAMRQTEPKVDVSKLVDQFSDDQLKAYKALNDLIMKLDKLVHANFDSEIAQVVNQQVKTLAADCNSRTVYLVDIDTRASKLELDSDMAEEVRECKKLKEKIEGLHTFLEASGVDLPNELYKSEYDDSGNRKGFALTRAGNKVLDLPRISDVDDSGEVAKRGRPAKTKTLILGIMNEDDSVTWHDNDHVGTTFVEVYGSLRTDHNPMGLFKIVEKSNQSVTTGWENPVDYAGNRWVAKVRS